MLSKIHSVSALLVSFAILCLGHGLHTTLLGVRASLEGFPQWSIGLIMSAYFLGFIFGTQVCGRLITSVGEIRTFGAFASTASVISLLHFLVIDEWTWMLFRLIYGICIAGLIMVIESWLNALSTRQNRGRILSVYMSINFLCLAIGQFFVFSAAPDESVLFMIVSILISFALVPVTVSKTVKQPERVETEHFKVVRLLRISPLATLGCFATGLTLGAFWGLAAVSFVQSGLSSNDTAVLIAMIFAGGFLFQWPVGYMSDVIGRRLVIITMLAISIIVSFLISRLLPEQTGLSWFLTVLVILFGGTANTLYSLFIALANDFLEPQYIIKASGGLITIHALGAILGPALAAMLMQFTGAGGLFIFIAFIQCLLIFAAVARALLGRKIPEETSEAFVALPPANAVPVVAELDPRQEAT